MIKYKYKWTVELNYRIPLLLFSEEEINKGCDPVKLEDLYVWEKDYVLREKEPGQLSGMGNFLEQGMNNLITGICKQEDTDNTIFYLDLNGLTGKEVNVSIRYFGGFYNVKCTTELDPNQYTTIEETVGNPVNMTLESAILNRIRECVLDNMSNCNLDTVMYKGTSYIVRMNSNNVEHTFDFYYPDQVVESRL